MGESQQELEGQCCGGITARVSAVQESQEGSVLSRNHGKGQCCAGITTGTSSIAASSAASDHSPRQQ